MKHTFIISQCNESFGYLPTKDSYKERGYEVTTSIFGPESEELLIRQILKMLYHQQRSESGRGGA